MTIKKIMYAQEKNEDNFGEKCFSSFNQKRIVAKLEKFSPCVVN